MIEKLKKCRICGAPAEDLIKVVDLGEQTLASIFPKDKNQKIIKAPLELVKCTRDCGLLQLNHTLDRDLMYGPSYGYRSGINRTMTDHLKEIVEYADSIVDLRDEDVVIDIGSNDGTLLSAYPDDVTSIGIDPSGEKFRKFYPKHATLLTDYFNSALVNTQAKIITSIAMFYDLQDPLEFMSDIKKCLAPDGIWITEQAYMPTMLKNNSFDTICHEHLEYYGMTQMKWMADKVGLEIIDVELNDINGGSFMVTLAHPDSKYDKDYVSVDTLLNKEMEDELDTLKPYKNFSRDIEHIKNQLKTVISGLGEQGGTVYGYGASTKGNVILQYCGLDSRDIGCIADRNPEKWGHFTPGTHIPIVSEDAARKQKPDYFLVLPWHFKPEIVSREKKFTDKGGRLIFPLPTLHVVPSKDYTLGGGK